MAKLTEILEIEKKRSTPEDNLIIRLWSDGSFYRAYEWSAWLCVRYINSFKPTKRFIKSTGTDMLFIGFPKTSLDKFKPQDATVEPFGDKGENLIMSLPASLVVPDKDCSLEESYQNWRTTVPLVEGRESNESGTKPPRIGTSQPVSMTGILKQMIEFPIENRTPIDCMLFLAEMKRQVSSLL